jgi:tetratricopeptide (TPR) repeat protein
MDKHVFTEKAVGEYFSKNFISVKLDMEKGEGKDIAVKYNVNAFPTYLFFDDEGSLVHRFTSARTKGDFINLSGKALNPESQFVTMIAKYEKGNKNENLLFDLSYSAVNALSYGETAEFAHEYLNTQNNWLTERNLKFIADFTFNESDTLFGFMKRNREAFMGAVGLEKYDSVLFWSVYNGISRKLGDGSRPTPDQLPELFAKANEYFEKVLPELKDRLMAIYSLDHYRMTKQWIKFAEAATQYLSKKIITNPSQVNQVAWTVGNHVDDEQFLRNALDWVNDSKSIKETADNTYILALLYSKLDEKEMAIQYAKRSIDIANTNSADKSAAEKLLEELSN